VINAPELAGPLDSPDIGSLFYCADDSLIPACVTTNGAEIFFGEIETLGARTDLVREGLERRCKALRLVGGLLEKVIREPQRRFPADTGQLGKLRGQIVDGSHPRTAA
jgi:hypothetical protein